MMHCKLFLRTASVRPVGVARWASDNADAVSRLCSSTLWRHAKLAIELAAARGFYPAPPPVRRQKRPAGSMTWFRLLGPSG